jgi:hypothetical protein
MSLKYKKNLSLSWRVLYSGKQHSSVKWKSTVVSEEHISSIIRAGEQTEQDTDMK